jgi:predicted metal-dependent HD superfamily phosphohydrolase
VSADDRTAEQSGATTTELLSAWEALITRHSASPRTGEFGQALLASWNEPHRSYHNITHLNDVLRHVDEPATRAADLDAVRLAAWYHDAVYSGQPDDEENSARRAENDLIALGLPTGLVTEVVRLVRLTATHDPAPGDRNGETLSDANLAILAAPADRATPPIPRLSAPNTLSCPMMRLGPGGRRSCARYSLGPVFTAHRTPDNIGRSALVPTSALNSVVSPRLRMPDSGYEQSQFPSTQWWSRT